MLALQCRDSSSPSPIFAPPSLFENRRLLNVSPTFPFSSQQHSIVQLERTSADYSSLLWDSEKPAACSSSTLSAISSDATPTSKSSAELRKEIANLEAEIIHLERSLLFLYRTAFKEQRRLTLSSFPGTPTQFNSVRTLQIPSNQSPLKLDECQHRDGLKHLNQTSPASAWACSDALGPNSKSRNENKISGHRSLADHLGTFCLTNSYDTPDRLSEDIVRCISSIYCKLANPLRSHSGLSASPISSMSSSTSLFSSHNHCNSWSPRCSGDSSVLKERSKEEHGPYALMMEVLDISIDDDSFSFAAAMLQNFRLLVRSLEKVDPTKMKREEKLAFWINIHNALVMHGYLAYGMRNRMKGSSILKASYNVGGQCINAYVIQDSILGIRPHLSAPWLQSIFSPGRKFKSGSARHAYALEYPEPLVHFALCSGAYSDPVVRVYRPKNIFQILRLAKEEFIQANVYVHKKNKIFLPKVFHYYAKDMSLSMPGLLDEVADCLSDVKHTGIRNLVKENSNQTINWLQQSSTFRYLIHGELAQERTV